MNNIRITYASDLHLDQYTSSYSSFGKTERLIQKVLNFNANEVTEIPDIIILAGDISDNPTQVFNACRVFSEMGIKVIITSGNHEMYNTTDKQDYKYRNIHAKIDEIKLRVRELKDVYFLDGECITINGVKIGGAMGWYDGSYYYKVCQGMYTEDILTHWKHYLNDYKAIPGLDDFRDLFSSEILKVKKVLSESPDIMVTHICPIADSIAILDKFKFDKGTGYYCFDGLDLIDPIYNAKSPRYWVHGHMHDKKEFKIYNTTFVRNPSGYPKRDNLTEPFKLEYLDMSYMDNDNE